jgi:hypothetical protein
MPRLIALLLKWSLIRQTSERAPGGFGIEGDGVMKM